MIYSVNTLWVIARLEKHDTSRVHLLLPTWNCLHKERKQSWVTTTEGHTWDLWLSMVHASAIGISTHWVQCPLVNALAWIFKDKLDKSTYDYIMYLQHHDRKKGDFPLLPLPMDVSKAICLQRSMMVPHLFFWKLQTGRIRQKSLQGLRACTLVSSFLAYSSILYPDRF